MTTGNVPVVEVGPFGPDKGKRVGNSSLFHPVIKAIFPKAIS